MARKPSIDSKVGSVDRYIATSYDKVKIVADNIACVIAVCALNDSGDLDQVAIDATQVAIDAAQVAADRIAVEAIYDTFDDRFLGVFALAPTVDNDGDPLVVGALYFNSTDDEMYVYTGVIWSQISSAGGGAGLWSANVADIYFDTGNVGIGIDTPAGLLHLYSGSAGVFTPGVDFDELIVEGSGNTGINIITANTTNNKAGIAFGRSGNEATNFLRYNVLFGDPSYFELGFQENFRVINNAGTTILEADQTGHVQFGNPSSELWGTEGNGTINVEGMFINGVAVAAGAATSDSVTVSALGTPTYNTLQENINTYQSAGFISGFLLTDGGTGTLDVAAGTGLIRATDSDVATLSAFDLGASAGLVLTDQQINYVYVEYNAGTPQFVITTIQRSDANTNILLGNVYRDGSVLHINTYRGHNVGAHSCKIINRFLATEPMQHESGAALSETGTRNIAITVGAFWEGLSRLTTIAKDTSVTDDFNYFYDNGASGWTEVAASTQVDNLQYDDGTGVLATLGNSQYGVHWIYLGTDSDLYVVYGLDSYLLAAAQEAQPGAVPPHIESHGTLIGKAIIQKNSTTFYSIESAFLTLFSSSGINDHTNLTNIGTNTHTQIDAHLADNTNAHQWITTGTNIYYPTGNVSIGKSNFENYTSTVSVLQLGGNLVSTTLKAEGAANWEERMFNAYYDTTSSTYKRISTDLATYYYQGWGWHQWFTAATGDAGTNIDWLEQLRLMPDQGVRVQSGITNNTTAQLQVHSATYGFSVSTDSALQYWGGRHKFDGGIHILEKSGISTTAGYGAIWVKNDSPNLLKFINDDNIIFDILMRRVATTTQLADITDTINTGTFKDTGVGVFNSTTGAPVWAIGNFDSSGWNDATGTLAHAPV